MAKAKKKFKIKIEKLKINPLWSLFLPVFLIVLFFGSYFGKIYPGIIVAGVNLSGKTPEEAIEILSNITPPKGIVLTSGSENENQTFEILSQSIEAKYDYSKTAEAAFRAGRSGNTIFDIETIIGSIFKPKEIGMRVSLNEDKLGESILTISGQIGNDPVYPSAKMESGKVIVDKGKSGEIVDENNLRILIGKNLSMAKGTPIEVPIEKVDPTLNSFEEAAFQKRAEAYSTKTLKLGFEFQTLEYSRNNLLSLLNGKGGFNDNEIQKIVEETSTKINRPVQEPKLVFEGQKVKEFLPSRDGITVKKEELTEMVERALKESENREEKEIVVLIPTTNVSPRVETGNINDLGIKELIGRGTSTYRGSIPSRIHNVALAANRVSGTLVAPGETFSFNGTVGDISEATGFQKAYIIQAGKTILGDGGGVCQVSTTLFRAVLNAGLPILERSAHAYRVGYYEQGSPPGIDATVFSPTVDFKFKNDTANHILIQAFPDSKNLSLVFELYGTKDGRVSEVGKPVITSTTPAPDDVYQDDPTLPAGTVKQTEHRALGTKLYFTYKVTRAGQKLFEKTFYSNYKPWANVFLRGTGV